MKVDLTGKTFGKLTVVALLPERAKNHMVWLCECECRQSCKVTTGSLNGGDVRSCGCLRRRSPEERFWSRVDKNGPVNESDPLARKGLGPCWLWMGGKNESGYGLFDHGPPKIFAHRIAWELLVGPIPEGLELDHLCRVPSCVNPKHLEPVTHAENVRRGQAGINMRQKTHCPQGHPYDKTHTIMQPVRGGPASGGYMTRVCLTCRREREKKAKAADPERFRERAREWRKSNPDKAKQASEKYKATHRDEIRQRVNERRAAAPEVARRRDRERRAANLEERRRYDREWKRAHRAEETQRARTRREANPEKYRQRDKERREANLEEYRRRDRERKAKKRAEERAKKASS